MMCPFCFRENDLEAMVCGSCGRDIAAPKSLVAERDGLLRKRDIVRQELSAARAELEELRRRRKRRI
jgi:hypothetical protein